MVEPYLNIEIMQRVRKINSKNPHNNPLQQKFLTQSLKSSQELPHNPKKLLHNKPIIGQTILTEQYLQIRIKISIKVQNIIQRNIVIAIFVIGDV
jgi:hypothetical protein